MKKITWADVSDLEMDICSALCDFIKEDDKLNETMRYVSLVVRRKMIEWLTEDGQKEGDAE